MIRKPLSAVLAALAMQASLAQALGLGDINLHSNLNEPLVAEIKLRGVGNLDASQILVRLASSEDFERSGVDKVFFLSELKFEVELLGGDTGVVRIRTKDLVREPYLDFVLEVKWPSGRVLREYTVLLDLPTFGPAPPVAVAAPKRESQATVSRRPAPESGGGDAAFSGDSYGPVASGDTLWSIANRSRPSGVSVQRMMVAIQRSNPEAFANGNINRLRAGYVLRLPNAEQLESLSQEAALAEVSAQTRDWKAGTTTGTKPSPSTTASESVPATAGTSKDEAYLRLAGEHAANGEGAAAGGSGNGSGAEVGDKLAAAQETLSATERENAELNSKVQALEAQVKDYQRLVELKSDDMASVQEGAATVAAAAAAKAPEPTAAATPAAQPAAKPQQDLNYSKPQAPAAEPSLLDSLLSNMVVWAALAVAAVGGLIALVMRRRGAMSYAPIPEGRHHVVREQAEAPSFVHAPQPTPVDIDEEVPAAAAAVSATAVETKPTADQDIGDPIGEAEIYIAYGRHERAAELLRSALAKEPGRSDVRLKLMELLIGQSNLEEFQTHYDVLSRQGDANAIEEARDLVRASTAPHLLHELDAPAGIQHEDSIEERMAGRAADAAAPSQVAAAEVAHELHDDLAVPMAEGLDLDADLSLDLDTESAAPADATPMHSLEQEFADLSADTSLDLEMPATALDDTTTSSELEAELATLSGDDLSLDLDGDLAETDLSQDFEADLASDLESELAATDLDAEIGELGELDAGGTTEPSAIDKDGDFDLGELDFSADTETPVEGHAANITGEPKPATADDDADLGFLDDTDEVETKLELARAYVDMGDLEGARDILDEVRTDGNQQQRDIAAELLAKIPSQTG